MDTITRFANEDISKFFVAGASKVNIMTNQTRGITDMPSCETCTYEITITACNAMEMKAT